MNLHDKVTQDDLDNPEVKLKAVRIMKERD